MTIAPDRTAGIDTGEDRRGRAAGPRRSWASTEPFELPDALSRLATRGDSWASVSRGFQLRALVSDTTAFAGVLGTSLVIRHGADLATLLLAAAAVMALVALVAALRGYVRRDLGDGPAEYQVLLRAGIAAVAGLMAFDFVVNADLPRLMVLGALPTAVAVALLGRYAHRRALHAVRRRGAAMMRTLVVGETHDASRVIDDLARAPYHGYEVTGVCVPSLDLPAEGLAVPVVGAVADVPQVVVDHHIDVVVVAGRPLSGDALRRLSWALDRAGTLLLVAPDLVEVTAPRLSLRPAAGLSLLEVEIAAPRPRLLAKVVMDRALGLLLLLAVGPVVAVLAGLVRLTSPGPAFYSQHRVGVDGERFTLWKLRSMYADADQRLAALRELDEGAGALFKMRRDPRVTPVGRILRRFSLDELPQLWNVVRGDMSLVGPRPPLVSEVEQYEDRVHRRLRVKPGLTGLWQVSGRSDLTWEESVRLDLRYVDNWSVTMDLMILWKTARAVVRGAGAY